MIIKAEQIKDDLPHVVNFSGGRTSAFMVYLFEKAKKKNPNLEVEYVYCDTGAEHPKTYEFIRNVVNHFNIDLTCIRTEIPLERGKGAIPRIVSLDECKPDLEPFRQVLRKHGTPTIAAPLCSDRMKSIPADKYSNKKYGRYQYYKWLGIRVDEQRRMKKADAQIDLFNKSKSEAIKIRYLGQASEFTKTDILFFWGEMPFDLDIPEYLGNCLFCIKKPEKKVALAAKAEPEAFARFIDMINEPETHEMHTRNLPKDIMYRNHMSLEMIKDKYEKIPTKTILDSLTGAEYQEDNLSCGESCEAMIGFDEFELTPNME